MMGPSRETVVRYLTNRGWIKQRSKDGRLLRLRLDQHEGLKGPVNVLFSTHADAEQQAMEVGLALQSLRQIYRLNEEEVRDRLVSLDYDRLLARVPDSYMKNEAIELRTIRSYLNGMRGLITSAATMEVTGKRFFAKIVRSGRDYADRCRFPHTFEGSFGVSIEAPIEAAGQEEMDFTQPEAPFGRRVVTTISKGFSSVERAAADDRADAIIEEDEGFNAGMCNDLVGIIRQSGVPRIDFSIALSPELKSEELSDTSFKLETRLIPILQDASKRMAKPFEPRRQEVVGRVVGLESNASPSELDVTSEPRQVKIASVDEDGKAFRVSARLEASDYRLAYDAHGTGAYVRLVGRLTRDRARTLDEVTDFTVL